MTFCQICRHETPGHEEGCPVLTGDPQRLTGDPQRGWEYPYGINPQDMQPYPNPLNQMQQAQVQGQMGYTPPFQGELTVIWKTEKEELLRRIEACEQAIDALERRLR